MPAKRRTYESQLSFHRVSSKVSDACSFKSLLKAPYSEKRMFNHKYVMSGKEHSVLYYARRSTIFNQSGPFGSPDLQIDFDWMSIQRI